MQSLKISAPPRDEVRVTRAPLPACRCKTERRYGWCDLCNGTGAYAECEHCCSEVTAGSVYAVECGGYDYTICSKPACLGAIIEECLEGHESDSPVADQLMLEGVAS